LFIVKNAQKQELAPVQVLRWWYPSSSIKEVH